MDEFVRAAEAFRHFSNNFIVNVQDDWIGGGFDPQHRLSEKIPGNARHDVLGPQTTVCALSVPAILKLSSSVVGKHDMLFVFVADDAWLRIRKLTARRQCQLEERAVAFERDDTAANDAAALLHSGPCCTIKAMPEPFDIGMRSSPILVELLHFFIGELIGEFSECVDAARIAESEVAGLADVPFRAVFREGATGLLNILQAVRQYGSSHGS